MTITKVLETWSTRGSRYQLALLELLTPTGATLYEIREYKWGCELGAHTNIPTFEKAKQELENVRAASLAIDNIHYLKVK